ISEGIDYLSRRYKVDRFIVYFQSYSNTYAPLSRLQLLYEQALSQPGVVGLAIGTRPDCIDEEKLDYLQELARHHYISVEYGLESPYQESLDWMNRGHDFASWQNAVRQTAGRGIEICAHLILGLPGESRGQMLETAATVSRYPLDHLKIHHLHVIKGTGLARLFKEKPFSLLSLTEYVELAAAFLERLRPGIRLQRLVGETHPRHLLAPRWGLRAAQVQRRIEQKLAEMNSWQGRLWPDEKNYFRGHETPDALTG
ncbi:MAG: TIGR01212 family radical SAM protein, partial [Calditrichia bacterium]